MPEKFSTFEVRDSSLGRLVDKVRAHAAAVQGSGLLALTNEAAAGAEAAARALAASRGTWIITVAPGVSSERGEIEGRRAAVGLVLPGVASVPVVESAGLERFGRQLAEQLKTGQSALLLMPADDQRSGWLGVLEGELGGRDARVFGAGTLPDREHYIAHAGEVHRARSVALAFDRRWPPRVVSSAGCRLISPLSTVTKTSAKTLLEFEGIPALNALSEYAGQLTDAPLILLAVATGETPLSVDGRQLALRPIVGVDPGRGGIDLNEELPIGTRVAFAVRDAHAARTDLDAHLRSLRQSCRGSAPGFGIYVSGSGRGRRLYDTADVDVRLIRSHFPDMPFIGFQSVFEISSDGARLTPQVDSGVFSVFCSPS